jgi:alanine racemase
VVDELAKARVRRHACNSAALLRDSRVWYDAVRPGLLLYGIVPPPLATTIPLRPVMSLTSRVTAVKGLRPGEGVGYGWRFQARRRDRSRWCQPGTPTASTRAWAAAARC